MSNCPSLEVVTMAGLKGITDTVALTLAHSCPDIQHVSFRNCDVTDVGICEMASGCPLLTLLAVAGVHCLTDKSIMALAEHCSHLEELYISGCDKITKQAVTYLKVGGGSGSGSEGRSVLFGLHLETVTCVCCLYNVRSPEVILSGYRNFPCFTMP